MVNFWFFFVVVDDDQSVLNFKPIEYRAGNGYAVIFAQLMLFFCDSNSFPFGCEWHFHVNQIHVAGSLLAMEVNFIECDERELIYICNAACRRKPHSAGARLIAHFQWHVNMRTINL